MRTHRGWITGLMIAASVALGHGHAEARTHRAAARPARLDPAPSAPSIVTGLAWRRHRLVIEGDSALQARLMSLEAPHRLVIDLYGAELSDPSLAQTLPIDDGPFHQLRVALHPEAGFVRFVLDCDRKANPRLTTLSNGTRLVIAPETMVAEAPPVHDVYGPKVPRQFREYGPPVPRELRVYGPAEPGRLAAVPAEHAEPPEPEDAAATPTPEARGPEWDGGPQSVSTLRLTERHGHATLVIAGDRPLSYELHQEWAPPRLSVRVPKGTFRGSLPDVPDGVESVEAHQEGGDWVLTCALARGVYRVEQRRSGKTLEVAWHRETLDAERPTVILDAGHGGDDPGAIGPGGTHESTITLGLVKAVAEALKARGGVNVVLTRTTDASVDLASRSRLIEALHPNLFVSLHGNSCASKDIGGFETYYRNDVSLPLAKYLHPQLVRALDRPDRGIRQAHLYVLRSTTVPSVLIESAYVSNPKEERLMASADFQHDLGVALAKGIVGFIEKTPVAKLPSGQGAD